MRPYCPKEQGVHSISMRHLLSLSISSQQGFRLWLQMTGAHLIFKQRLILERSLRVKKWKIRLMPVPPEVLFYIHISRKNYQLLVTPPFVMDQIMSSLNSRLKALPTGVTVFRDRAFNEVITVIEVTRSSTWYDWCSYGEVTPGSPCQGKRPWEDTASARQGQKPWRNQPCRRLDPGLPASRTAGT